jgi:hypothetical protein
MSSQLIFAQRAIPFYDFHRLCTWTVPCTRLRHADRNQTPAAAMDLADTPLCDETRSRFAKHCFDTYKARIVLERR